VRKETLTGSTLHYLRLYYTVIFLIYVFEFISRVAIYTYYTSWWSIVCAQALYILILFALSLLLSFITAVIQYLIRSKDRATYLAEMLLTIFFVYMYTYYLLAFDKEGGLLKRYWMPGILPVVIVIFSGSFYIKFRPKISRVIWNIARSTWRVASILALVMFLLTIYKVSAFVVETRMEGEASVASHDGPGKGLTNIIVVSFDALAAEDMSLYGYHRDTTPRMNDFAGECHVFENMFSCAVSTTPFVISWLTSQYPWVHKVLDSGDYLKKGREENVFTQLPEYKIITVVGADMAQPVLVGLGGKNITNITDNPLLKVMPNVDNFLYRYCDHTVPANELTGFWMLLPRRETDRLFIPYVPPNANGDYVLDARVTFRQALKGIEKEKGPFLMWVHVFQPNPHHADIHSTDPPEPFLYKYTDRDVEIPEDIWHNGRYKPDRQGDVDLLRARYNETVSYADHCFGEFMEELKKREDYHKFAIIVTSDHGESFEKGWRGHSRHFLYNPVINVPLLVHLPGQKQGKRIHAVASSVDLSPTILELAGKDTPRWMQGESLLPYMRGERTVSSRPKYAHAGVIAVMFGGYKMIYNPLYKTTELYRLDDKDESREISREEPGVTRGLLKYCGQ